MNLIIEIYWGGEPFSGTDIIPFEYSSKEEFVYDVLEKRRNSEEGYVVLFDHYLYDIDLESIEHNVYTLEEWFSYRKNTNVLV